METIWKEQRFKTTKDQRSISYRFHTTKIQQNFFRTIKSENEFEVHEIKNPNRKIFGKNWRRFYSSQRFLLRLEIVSRLKSKSLSSPRHKDTPNFWYDRTNDKYEKRRNFWRVYELRKRHTVKFVGRVWLVLVIGMFLLVTMSESKRVVVAYFDTFT